MNNNQIRQQFLISLLDIYSLSGSNGDWATFWNFYHELRLSNQENVQDKFIESQCNTIAKSLSTLGKEDTAVKDFLAKLPLHFSKAILSWPSPTPEEIKLLMTD